MKKAQANREEKQDEQMNSTRIYGRLHRLLARFFLRLFRVRVHFAEREGAFAGSGLPIDEDLGVGEGGASEL